MFKKCVIEFSVDTREPARSNFEYRYMKLYKFKSANPTNDKTRETLELKSGIAVRFRPLEALHGSSNHWQTVGSMPTAWLK